MFLRTENQIQILEVSAFFQASQKHKECRPVGAFSETISDKII